MTTSFAISADDFARGSAPCAKSRPNVFAPTLRGRFGQNAKPKLARNFDTRSGDQGDGMIGGILLDCIIGSIFPGLGNVFNGLSALDLIDVYDTARDAFGPSAREQRNARTQMAPARRPVSAGRQLLALVFG